MESKNWIIGLIVMVVLIAGISYWGFVKNNQNSSVLGLKTEAVPEYASDSAKVMYFYQDDCIHCINQKVVLKELAQEGYRVKLMNIGKEYPENQSAWQSVNPDGPYKINGTPTFVASNGDRLDGEQNKENLKKFLDEHK